MSRIKTVEQLIREHIHFTVENGLTSNELMQSSVPLRGILVTYCRETAIKNKNLGCGLHGQPTLVPYCRVAAIKNKNFGLWAAWTAHVGTLLPLRGNKKQECGLWAAWAAHVGSLLPLRGNKKREFGLWAAWTAHVGLSHGHGVRPGVSDNFLRGVAPGRSDRVCPIVVF
ncbi:MAG: hypothetical protein LBF64_05595 [Oscillospiraceae bacterium]|nr:hypothetical protein [Oscillospiraceae bacterium]